MLLGGFFDVEKKTHQLEELEAQTQTENFWNNAEEAKKILKERSRLQEILNLSKKIESGVSDAQAAIELASDSGEEEFLIEALNSIKEVESLISKEEFQLKMSGEHDVNSAILDINGGAGGTEAQDWAEMLLRMYIRWAERKGFEVELLDSLPGEVAGIKSATLQINGEYAYGYLRSEQGVHRLVRISPFDSNDRRHTSFASVSVTPEIETEIEIEIDEKDLRVDTYRSSGAGGQHVNKTDSAVRLTHMPSGIVVACQIDRSQHKNKERAMKMLKAKLYDLQQQEMAEKLDSIKGARMKIDFGSQIRSYVMQPYRMVKDLRTNYESSSVDSVLDGDIDGFIEAYLVNSVNN